MTQVQLADHCGEAGQSNGMATDLLLDGMCHQVAALELLATMRIRSSLGPARLTYRFGGCDYRLRHVGNEIVTSLLA